MNRDTVEKQLLSYFPADVVNSLLNVYVKSIGEYRKGQWKYVVNELGQFIECSRMMIEHKLGTPGITLSSRLDIFDDGQLKKWESTAGSVEYRVIIPRVLFSMACIRNKRGAIHVNDIDPNCMDASLLLNEAKWVLAEFFRLSSQLSFTETEETVKSITNKETSLIWHVNGITRVMDWSMSTKDQILILLYDRDKQTDRELQKSVEYGHTTKFRGHLLDLHKKRLIEYDGLTCTLSTTGIVQAERILHSYSPMV